MFVAIAFVFSLFAAQLIKIQGLESSGVSAAALGERAEKVTIPAHRGQIVDAKGTVLANSIDRRNVTGDSLAMSQYHKTVNGKRTQVGLKGAAQDMAPLLGVPEEELAATLKKAFAAKSQFTYLAKDIAPTQWRSIDNLGIPGVFSEQTVRREYPQGTSTAPLIGWVNQSSEPGGGVEQMLNSQLNGKPGLHVYERARDGSPIATGDGQDVKAVPGRNVKLTINNDMQWFAQNALAKRVKETDGLSGTAVVLDAKTGKLLSAASYPSFDPNNMGSAEGFLQSRPFTEVYEPGSTSKAITMAAALDQGLVTEKTKVTVPNRIERAGRPFKDSHDHGTLKLTTAGVLAQSSNIGTVLVGEKMSRKTIHTYLTDFGMGSPSGIGFPGESRGIVASPDSWKGDQRYTVLFGQGVAGTAVQQASVFQAIANGGVQQPIKLIDGYADDNGGWTPPEDDRVAKQVIKPRTADTLTGMMRSVTDEKYGTATQAAVPGYTVAGKTSTAERYDSEMKKYSGTTASFIGYAPVADPEFVVAVTIQRPRKGTYGGPVAGPVFSQIMGYALRDRGVPPKKGGPGPYPLTATAQSAKSPGRDE
ncbi:peptidoglycan D,D-transpeptidase FtsI family protein [Demetria terragena]|uniref:peptidoglycan D,D-transpeptidase FtsI family protein n=1 Tax=Demetria terragena TaxID=63959 RepID=UPI00037A0BE1|nr:penicillin-binding protein 2 [Demetria terragena]